MRYGSNLLTGQQVRLAAITQADVAVFGPWFASVELLRLLNPGPVFPFTMQDEQDWFDSTRKDRSRYNFAIRTLEEDRMIGTCGAFDLNWPARYCTLGISVGDPEYQGRGFGTDAMRVLVRYCFMELGLNRVSLQVFSYNQRAVASYQKVGFVQEGVLRETIYRDGAYHDIIVMSILRREWTE